MAGMGGRVRRKPVPAVQQSYILLERNQYGKNKINGIFLQGMRI